MTDDVGCGFARGRLRYYRRYGGAGILNLPGTLVPGTPFTASVEYAYVRTANATASELIARACRLTLANVSQAAW